LPRRRSFEWCAARDLDDRNFGRLLEVDALHALERLGIGLGQVGLFPRVFAEVVELERAVVSEGDDLEVVRERLGHLNAQIRLEAHCGSGHLNA
jgi:hypothetical protein